jgi:hypothetical protein
MGGIGSRWRLLLALTIGIVIAQFAGWPGAMAGVAGIGPVTPDPALCRVEPRTIEELRALYAAATPVAETAATARAVPVGHPADPATAAQVVTTVHEAFACLNVGDFLRFVALLTDDALVTSFPWIGEELAGDRVPPEVEAPVAVPVDQRQTLLAVAGISRLGDGRVGAFITFLDPASDATGADALYLIFVLQGDRWRIDAVIDFGEG